MSVKTADLRNGVIVSLPGNYTTFENLVKDFSTLSGQPIKSFKYKVTK